MPLRLGTWFSRIQRLWVVKRAIPRDSRLSSKIGSISGTLVLKITPTSNSPTSCWLLSVLELARRAELGGATCWLPWKMCEPIGASGQTPIAAAGSLLRE